MQTLAWALNDWAFFLLFFSSFSFAWTRLSLQRWTRLRFVGIVSAHFGSLSALLEAYLHPLVKASLSLFSASFRTLRTFSLLHWNPFCTYWNPVWCIGLACASLEASILRWNPICIMGIVFVSLEPLSAFFGSLSGTFCCIESRY